jgi:hypothetical protein
MTDPQSLTNPSTYLHAALRAFVSSAYERVDKLLTIDVFNFGSESEKYPDLKTLREKLGDEAIKWRHRNAFIADLIESTASDPSLTPLQIFKTLTNYFFCYVKVDRRGTKPVSTVRVLFPVDFQCDFCPLQKNSSDLCANSCFRYAFFPHKPVEMLKAEYDAHFLAAQFALADATFAAATPDLERRGKGPIPIAALMVPLLLGEPLLFVDVGSEQPEQYLIDLNGKLLVAERRFTHMNDDLGIRSEGFVPITINKRSFMPGFGIEASGGSVRGEAQQQWVPGFPASAPFCIELYSPMPEWFARSWEDSQENASNSREYIFYDSESVRSTSDKTPIPRFCSTKINKKQSQELAAVLEQIVQVLAVGFNLQHYSELMAIQFVSWLRGVLKSGAYQAFVPTLERLYRLKMNMPPSEKLPEQIETMFEFIRGTPRILGDVLTRGHHGGLLLAGQVLSEFSVDLASIKDVRKLAHHVSERTDDQITVEDLVYEPTFNCTEPPEAWDLGQRLKSADSEDVLAPLVIEVMMNHGQLSKGRPIRYHICRDQYQHRLSLHFRSTPTEAVDLKTYLNLRQGLPQRESGTNGDSGGVGVALSRMIAEEFGFEYVIELGRDEKQNPAKHKFEVKEYRRDLHTRIYFGDNV